MLNESITKSFVEYLCSSINYKMLDGAIRNQHALQFPAFFSFFGNNIKWITGGAFVPHNFGVGIHLHDVP